jgi:hypothetical protein
VEIPFFHSEGERVQVARVRRERQRFGTPVVLRNEAKPGFSGMSVGTYKSYRSYSIFGFLAL